MPLIWYMPKLLDVHQWGMYDNIQATYEVAPINYRVNYCTQMMTMTMQDDDDNANDYATAQLHILSWPLGQLSQKTRLLTCESI